MKRDLALGAIFLFGLAASLHAQTVKVKDGGVTILAGGAMRSEGEVRVAGAGNPGLALSEGAILYMAPGAVLSIGDGVNPGTLTTSGTLAPTITTSGTVGTHFWGFTAASTGTLSISALVLTSLDANGLTLSAGSTVTGNALSGLTFDYIASGGTYLRFLHTSGAFTLTNPVFGNTGGTNPFNVSTPSGTTPSALTVTVSGAAGARSGAAYENDHGAGTDEAPATSTILWPGGGGNPPAAPANFTPSLTSSTFILWSWSDVADETGYEIHDDAHNVKGTAPANVTSFAETGLLENSSYSRHVHAISGGGTSDPSNTAGTVTTIHDPLLSDFAPRIVSATSIEISVVPPPNPSVGQTGCQIERTSDNTNWTLVQPFASSYLFTDAVSSGVSYRYRIRYRNSAGVVTPESPSYLVETIPALFVPVTGSATNDTTPFFDWSDVPGKSPLTYEIQVDDSADFSSPEIQETGLALSQFQPATPLAPGTYHWRVRAKFAGANFGPWSVAASISIETTAPGTAILESPPNGGFVGTTTPTFDWSDVADPSGVSYRLQIDSTPAFSAPVIDTAAISASTYTIGTTLSVGTWFWRIQATDLAGNTGSFSGASGFTIDLTAPPAVTLSMPTNESVVATGTPSFSWTSVTDPAGVTYRIQIDKEETFAAPLTLDAGGLTAASFTPTDSLDDGSYVWRVQAVDGAGNVSTSVVFKFIVDTTAAPSAPLVASSNARKTNDSTPAITGKTAEGAITIKVFVNGLLDGTTTSTPTGDWSYSPTVGRVDGTYSVDAKTSNGNGDSAGSNSVSIEIDTVANPPTNVTATALNAQVHVSWVASPDGDIVGYEVYRKLASDPDSSYAKIHSDLVVGTQYCDSTVINGIQYCYRVKAVDTTLQEGP